MTAEFVVRFSDAPARARAAIEGVDLGGRELALVRDLKGRIRAILPGPRDAAGEAVRLRLAAALSQVLGAYGFPQDSQVLWADELPGSWELIRKGARPLGGPPGAPAVYLVDRQITGQDWTAAPVRRRTRNPRITFFALKGGVGRSTALASWAWYLARAGRKVLVLDLDLESPGVTSTLLRPDEAADFGIVDWLVEDGVGQGGAVEQELLAPSRLSERFDGEIMVAGAYGARTGEYLPKLARAYAGVGADGPDSWAERLERMTTRLEEAVRPDVTVLDSRAGLQDIAAVAVSRMGADALLFAVDTEQTWQGYGMLFAEWAQHPYLTALRDHLQVVAGMVPPEGPEEYLARAGQRSWDLFRELIYDREPAGVTAAYSFDLNDEDAPHHPWPVYWDRGLRQFDPAARGAVDAKAVERSLGAFAPLAEQLLATADPEAMP